MAPYLGRHIKFMGRSENKFQLRVGIYQISDNV